MTAKASLLHGLQDPNYRTARLSTGLTGLNYIRDEIIMTESPAGGDKSSRLSFRGIGWSANRRDPRGVKVQTPRSSLPRKLEAV